MPFIADGFQRVSPSECVRKLQMVQVVFDNFGGGPPTLTFTDRVENLVDGVPTGTQFEEQLPVPDLSTPAGAAVVEALRLYWHSHSDALGNV